MPEIWLHYGSVEVNVDIRAENLGQTIETRPKPLDSTALEAEISQINIEDGTLLIVPKPDPPTLKVLHILLAKLDSQHASSMTAITPPQHLTVLKRGVEGTGCKSLHYGAYEDVGTAEGTIISLPTAFKEHSKKMLVSTASFDPMFGFEGGPVTLLKSLGQSLMGEALKRCNTSEPLPGRPDGASELALKAAGLVGEASSIEIVAHGDEVAAVHAGSIKSAHAEASSHLLRSAHEQLDEAVRGMLVSPGVEHAGGSLRSSLRAMWNVLGGLKDNGTVVLLAESSSGLGCDAFSKYVTGQLSVEDALKNSSYVDGLEDLLYLQRVSRKFNIVVVSTLPKYYVEMKLGLRSAYRVSDAMNYLYSTQGSKTKVCVVPHASETLISLVQQSRDMPT